MGANALSRAVTSVLILSALALLGCDHESPAPEPRPTGPFGMPQDVWDVTRYILVPLFLTILGKYVEEWFNHKFQTRERIKRVGRQVRDRMKG